MNAKIDVAIRQLCVARGEIGIAVRIEFHRSVSWIVIQSSLE